MRPAGRRERHTLKNLFQEARIPPWQRDRLPFVFLDDELVYVPGIGLAETYQAAGDEEGLLWDWQPDSDQLHG